MQEVIMAGFGGQGIMLIGKLLAYAGMEEGKEVCWLPSYGPEMRGGTANCTVVLSKRPIGSPVIETPTACIVMNRPSLDRFGPKVKKNGLLIVNSSLIDVPANRNDVDVVYIPCNQVAIECGNGKAANMVALGAYIGKSEAVKIETLIALVRQQFSSHANLVELNIQTLQKGYALVKNQGKK